MSACDGSWNGSFARMPAARTGAGESGRSRRPVKARRVLTPLSPVPARLAVARAAATRPSHHPSDARNQRDYRRGNSERHAEAVDGTPFATFESVNDCDSTDHAASRADSFPVDIHFSSYGWST